MNITMNSASQPASGANAGKGAVTGASTAGGPPLDPAAAVAQPGAQAPLAFLQFMQGEAPAAPDALPQPELASLPDDASAGAVPSTDAQEEHSDAGQAELAAMGSPLTPAMMAMPAALPAALRLMAGSQERQARAADAAPATTTAARDAAPQAGVPASPLAPASALPVQGSDTATAAFARASAAVQQAQPAVAPQAAAAQAGDTAGADSQSASQPAAGSAGFGVAAPAAPALAARDGGTLALSGPPTAWRQSLQEALGERLNLTLGKNAEQAVIRLDPPMLGRVEISIRHAAGSLEVNISATHGEVLRQLNTVSDSLRNDLAQRQYLDVSVNVSQAPARAQAAAQPGAGFGADAQGRGRQQGQDHDEHAPGAALAEANQSTTAFSLGGRA